MLMPDRILPELGRPSKVRLPLYMRLAGRVSITVTLFTDWLFTDEMAILNCTMSEGLAYTEVYQFKFPEDRFLTVVTSDSDV